MISHTGTVWQRFRMTLNDIHDIGSAAMMMMMMMIIIIIMIISNMNHSTNEMMMEYNG